MYEDIYNRFQSGHLKYAWVLGRNETESLNDTLHKSDRHNGAIAHLSKNRVYCTVNVSRMSHRKWRESKQQLTSWPDLALPGCCLVCLHILCDILLTFTVVTISDKDCISSSLEGGERLNA